MSRNRHTAVGLVEAFGKLRPPRLHSDTVDVAMEARGLAPGGARTVIATPAFGPGDAVFVVLALGTLAVCFAAVATSPG
ncbi:hypothetical protein [Neomesorhizobium albiziae]|uniref:hypothetical protein n=1 Tax=Neomesorhizobium albiziae TaxID=335020 RepID=UPI00122CFFC6|nr:hypothetical protein [Mesorhizobium albiziae]